MSNLVVQAKDTYDPADYVSVHKDHLAKLREDLARYENAHKVLVGERDELLDRIDELLGQLAEKVVTEQAGDRT